MNEYPRAGLDLVDRVGGGAGHLAVPQPAPAKRDRRPDRAEAGLPVRVPRLGHRLQGAVQLPLAHRHGRERRLRHARGRRAAVRGRSSGASTSAGWTSERRARATSSASSRVRASPANAASSTISSSRPTSGPGSIPSSAINSSPRTGGDGGLVPPRERLARPARAPAPGAPPPPPCAFAGRGSPAGRRPTAPSPPARPARTHACSGTRAGASAAARGRGSRGADDAARAPRRSRRAPCCACSRRTTSRAMPAPTPSWPQNSTRPSAVTARVAGLPASCSSAPRRSACPRVSSSASGRRSSARDALAQLAEHGLRVALDLDQPLEHLERVPPHVQVVVGVLLHSLQPVELRQQMGQQTRAVHQLDPAPPGRRSRSAGAARRRSARARPRRCAGAARRASASVAGSTSKPSSQAKRAMRSTRSGSSANERSADGAQEPPAPGPPPHRAGRPARRRRRAAAAIALTREVPQREVGLDAVAAQRGDVGLPRAVPRDHAPGAEALREREHVRVGRRREARARPARRSPATTMSTSVDRPVEQCIAHGPADQPCLARPTAPSARCATAGERSRRATGSVKTGSTRRRPRAARGRRSRT